MRAARLLVTSPQLPSSPFVEKRTPIDQLGSHRLPRSTF
jgi:hypothetical protein